MKTSLHGNRFRHHHHPSKNLCPNPYSHAIIFDHHLLHIVLQEDSPIINSLHKEVKTISPILITSIHWQRIQQMFCIVKNNCWTLTLLQERHKRFIHRIFLLIISTDLHLPLLSIITVADPHHPHQTTTTKTELPHHPLLIKIMKIFHLHYHKNRVPLDSPVIMTGSIELTVCQQHQSWKSTKRWIQEKCRKTIMTQGVAGIIVKPTLNNDHILCIATIAEKDVKSILPILQDRGIKGDDHRIILGTLVKVIVH